MKKKTKEALMLTILAANPDLNVPQVAERVGVALSTAYRLIGGLKKQGVLKQEKYGGAWSFPK